MVGRQEDLQDLYIVAKREISELTCSIKTMQQKLGTVQNAVSAVRL